MDRVKDIAVILTLESRRKEKRKLWARKGLKKITSAELEQYWNNRLENPSPEDIELYHKSLAIHNSLLSGNNRSAAVKKTGYPPTKDMLNSFAKSMLKWAKKGFRVVSAEQLDARLRECKRCEYWNPEALSGTGRCKICGCSTQAKLRLATEKCPLDKWGPVADPNDSYEQPNQHPNSNPEPNPSAA